MTDDEKVSCFEIEITDAGKADVIYKDEVKKTW